jgi:hypothetical protein
VDAGARKRLRKGAATSNVRGERRGYAARLAIAIATVLCVVGLEPSRSLAATTYRCEVDGRVTYGDAPCANGRQSTVETNDARSAKDRADAARRVATDRAQVDALDRERSRQDSADARKAAADAKRIAAARLRQTRTCARLARQVATAHDASDLAGPADQTKKQRAARRADEEFGAVCKHG